MKSPTEKTHSTLPLKTTFTTQEIKANKRKQHLRWSQSLTAPYSKLGEFQAGNNIVKC